MLIRNRDNSTGSILAMFGGMTWNIASFLVVPLHAAKQIGPNGTLKKSAALLRKAIVRKEVTRLRWIFVRIQGAISGA